MKITCEIVKDILPLYIRPLAKSSLQFVIINTGNEIKPQPEPLTSVSIFFRDYPEPFNETDGMFICCAPA